MLVRVQRDVANLQWTIEVYDTTGGNYLSGTAAIAAFGPVSWAGKTINVSSGENVAFVRWFSSVVPLGTPIPITATGDLGDWEFEGNLTDSSGHGLTMSGGTFSFVPTPTYPPACSAGKPQSFRAGHPGALDGTGSCAPGWRGYAHFLVAAVIRAGGNLGPNAHASAASSAVEASRSGRLPTKTRPSP